MSFYSNWKMQKCLQKESLIIQSFSDNNNILIHLGRFPHMHKYINLDNMLYTKQYLYFLPNIVSCSFSQNINTFHLHKTWENQIQQYIKRYA